jgi:hypothetical protein
MTAWLTLPLAQITSAWHLLGLMLAGLPAPGPSSVLMTVAAVTLAGLILAVLSCGSRICAGACASPLTGRETALSRKSWGAAFQRQLDPDSAGRSRPRAPSAAPAAA